MDTFSFSVEGKPVPYTRVTQRSKYQSTGWRRYLDWRAKVQAGFLNSVKDGETRRACASSMVVNGKPLDTHHHKVFVWVEMCFNDFHHGDPDNIMKGVLDALLVSDKYVAGQFDFRYSPEYSGVEIKIQIGKKITTI